MMFLSCNYSIQIQPSQVEMFIAHQEHPRIEQWVEIRYDAHGMFLVGNLQISLQAAPLHQTSTIAAAVALSPAPADGLVALPVGIEAVLGAVDHSAAPGTLVGLVGVFDTTRAQERVGEELVQQTALVTTMRPGAREVRSQ